MEPPFFEVHWIIGNKKYSDHYKRKSTAQKRYENLKVDGIPAYWNYRKSFALSVDAVEQIELCNGFVHALVNLLKN